MAIRKNTAMLTSSSERKIIKKLKRKGRKNEMQKKIKLFEREGYKMFEAGKEMNVSKKEMNKEMKEWKKKGYKY